MQNNDRSWREISKNDPDYPRRLRALGSMPEKLYLKGELPGDEPAVAIVGARQCSNYGRRQARRFGRALAEKGVAIISGMALGIDACAQEGALEGGGKSYAVLGNGVDICYPPGNRKLYEALIKKGGILSEYEMGSEPLSWHFPIRNRIISGLADIVLVIEARKKSGSLITVDYALEQGRTVFALPGRAGDALSDGCNLLIAQGAGIACSPESILEELELLYIRQNDERGKDRIFRKNGKPLRRKDVRNIRTDKGGNQEKRGRTDRAGRTEEAEKGDKETGRLQNREADESFLKDLTPSGRLMALALTDDPSTLDDLIRRTSLSPSAAMEAITELLLMGEAREVYAHLYVRGW